MMLTELLNDIFYHYHTPTIRYKHLAFSSKDLSVLNELQQTLRMVLPDYDVWDGFRPCDIAPEQSCSRFDFLKQTFSHQKPLLIFYPDGWLRHWSLQDQQTFWAQLSIQCGNQNIVVLSNENPEFAKQNNRYFLPHPLPNTEITLWVSSKNTFYTESL